MIREDWPAAVAAIDRVTADPSREDRPGLLLLRAEILAFQMGRTSEGRRIFDDVAAGDSYAAPAARLDVAILQLQSGDKDEGMALLRALETDRATPADIASRAMLVRARQFENDDTWDEALPILRRILRLYPFTSAAIEAPLVATRHYIEAGDREMARRSLERAREYYLSLMDRSSKFGGDRFAVADMLVENYLVAGEAQEAAELLQTSSSRWDDASTAGGMYRSALIYSDVLDDPVSARHILEKCIELFPDTRYAKIAQRQLRALEAKN
jgi:tetratricopeptide (TPR) repeat protein